MRCDLFEEESSSRYAALKVRRGRAPGTGHCAPLGATRLTLSWDGRGVRLTSSLEEVILPRKEVIQPHLPVRLPCYDFTPLTNHTFGASLWADDFGCNRLGWCDGRCVQGPGTYSPRRADPRLLATPTSWRRVAASNPNWDRLWGFAPARAVAAHCAGHCSTCAAQDIRGMMT